MFRFTITNSLVELIRGRMKDKLFQRNIYGIKQSEDVLSLMGSIGDLRRCFILSTNLWLQPLFNMVQWLQCSDLTCSSIDSWKPPQFYKHVPSGGPASQQATVMVGMRLFGGIILTEFSFYKNFETEGLGANTCRAVLGLSGRSSCSEGNRIILDCLLCPVARHLCCNSN